MDTLETVLREKRISTQSDYHARLGRIWRLYGAAERLHAPLAYAAFEFRIAMERSLQELLYLIKNMNLSEKELKYDIGDIVKALYKTEGGGKECKDRLTRRLIFNSVYCKYIPTPYRPPKNVAQVDIAGIHVFWRKLSAYCHRQLKPDNTWGDANWVEDGYKLLNEVEEYIWKIMVDSSIGWMDSASLPEAVKPSMNEFVEGKITRTSLEGRLKIIMPVLEWKDKFRLHVLN